jgi:hypothetical protein
MYSGGAMMQHGYFYELESVYTPGFQHDDLIASTKEKASGLRMPKGGREICKKRNR